MRRRRSTPRPLACAPRTPTSTPSAGSPWAAWATTPTAVESLRLAVALRPDDSELHYELGVALGRDGRHAEAEASLREAIRLRPNSVKARANLALGLGRQGRHAEAEAAYREALERGPDRPALRRGLGVSLYWQGRYAEAEAAFAEAISAQARLPPGPLRSRGDAGRAAALARGRGRLPPGARARAGHVTAHAALAASCSLTGPPGRRPRAIAARRSAHDPAMARAHFTLWEVLERQGKYAELEEAALGALAVRPDHPDAQARLARARALGRRPPRRPA